MTNKAIIWLSLLVFGGVAWFFYQNQPSVTPIDVPSVASQSQVSDIRASHTNPNTGQIEYTLTAKTLTQNQDGQTILSDVVLIWTPPTGETYEITSPQATFDDQSGDMHLMGGFVLAQKPNNSPQHITITGNSLMGNTHTYQLNSDEPLTITQTDNQINHTFFANKMNANLHTGDYEFLGMTAQFEPPQRVDKPLF